MLLLEPAKRTLIHSYSDALSANANTISCYSLEEVMAEKIRALVQRKYTAPRDYYDIWYLSTNHKELNHKRIVEAFHNKMKYKNLAFTGIDQLINPKNERLLKRSWQNSLSHQIAKDKLADYTTVIAEVRRYFERIFIKIV